MIRIAWIWGSVVRCFRRQFSSWLGNLIFFATHFASASSDCVIMAERKFQDDLAYPPRAMKADRAAAAGRVYTRTLEGACPA